ncbi:MAG TPA: hypothetical protein VMF11_08245 [Candidatus Baltobacteraceae bacterium]|nr:hypothetical protein [Candidatus Baltobacteraceae bacterium]
MKIEEEVPVSVPMRAVKAVVKKTAKVYPPHEHFGSPLNICRVCGEKYTYTPKPYGIGEKK